MVGQALMVGFRWRELELEAKALRTATNVHARLLFPLNSQSYKFVTFNFLAVTPTLVHLELQ